MNNNTNDDSMLNDLFKASHEGAMPPSESLMARVMADARAVQSGFGVVAVPKRRRTGVLQFIQVLGGWPSMAGLASAAVAGVWLGISPPDSLGQMAESYLGLSEADYLIDMAPDAGFGMDEGA